MLFRSNIGVELGAHSAPDGYTLLSGTAAIAISQTIFKNISYDLTRDFEPVALVADTPQGIIGKASLPARNLAELTAWLKQNPGKATMGSIGVAGPSDVSAIFFQQKTGTSFQLVPYRGGAPLLQDLVGGQIDLGLFLVPAFLEQMRAGQIRGYAVLAKRRMAAAPDLPTIEEAGGPELTSTVWHALWAPKGTPKETVAALNAAVVKALDDPAVQKRFADLGQDIWPREQRTPEALAAHHKAEIDKWWPIIKAANIKASN